MRARARTGWVVGLVGLGLLLVVASSARAGQPSQGDARLDALWAEYLEIRKHREVDTNRRRARIATELGEIGSKGALARALEIFEKDPEIEARLSAMRVLIAKGDLKLVARVVRKAKGDKECLSRWLGTLLPTAQDECVGPWILAKSRLLNSSNTRIHAVEALGLMRVEAAQSALCRLYDKNRKSHRNAPLLCEILRALGRIGSPASRCRILDAGLSGRAWERRVAAEFLLGYADEDGACALIMRELLGDQAGSVREAAVRAVSAAKAEAYVPELIACLEDPWLRVRPAARNALASIADKDLGCEPAQWNTWWKRRQAGQEVSGDSMTIVESKDDRLHTNAVVFLLDISKSNSWQAPSMKNRIDVAKEKVIGLIRRMEEPTVFNVVAVCGRPFPWQSAKRRGGPLVPASEKNKKKAIEWVRERECAVHTNTWDALRLAIEDHENVDTVHYVTDGALRIGGYVYWEEMPMRVKELNRLADVCVHVRYLTWGGLQKWALKYEDVEEQQGWLEDVATRSGGTFVLQRAP